MKVKDITALIEAIAPPAYQESYDNAGLQTGDPEQSIEAVLLCLDSTEAVVDEAIQKGCKLIIAHHPLIFKGLKQINGKTDVERTLIKAIRNGIAIYAAHTNLDNVFYKGVNHKLAQRLGLLSPQILQPKTGQLVKLVVYVPPAYEDTIRQAFFDAGAGNIGRYSECSFSMTGQGTFRPGADAKPFSGQNGIREQAEEVRIEALVPAHLSDKVLISVRAVHPYEEMAYEQIALENAHAELGSGMIGTLPEPMDALEFLNLLKNKLDLALVKHTNFEGKISRVAVCGGSGSFLLSAAIRSGADAFVTADVKYHEFFDAIGKLMFCDVGHYESEISTLELFYEVIQEKFPTFAVRFCETSTNPIHYHK